MTANIFRFFGALVSISLTFYVATVYSSSIASSFFIAYSSIFVLAALLKFGFEDAVLKAASSKSESSAAPSWIIMITFLSAIFSTLIYHLEIYIPLKIPKNDFILISYILPMSVFYGLIGFYLQGKKKYILSTLVQAIFVPSLFILLSFFSNFYSLDYKLLFIYLVAVSLSTIFTLLIFLLNINGIRYLTIKDFMRINWNEQKFLYLNSVVAIMFLHGIILAASFSLSESEIIELNLILRLCQVSSLMILVLNFTFAPNIRGYFEKKNYTAISNTYKRSIYIGATLSIFISIFYYFFINNLTNRYFEIAIPQTEFWILWISYAINLCIGTIGYLYIMLDRAKVSSLMGFAITITMFSVIWYFVPEKLIEFVIIISIFNAMTRALLAVNLKFSKIETI
jgi:O-antigen/teichoic acid export membrane protein